MKGGLVADIVVAIIILINLIICTHRGFVRCVIGSFSNILAFIVAVLSAEPLTNFFENKFGWETKVASWHIPFVSAHTLLAFLIGIAVFVIVRLLCILIDKLLQVMKEKMKAINVVDRILGTVFGAIAAMTELTLLFALINEFGLVEKLSLTESGGGYLAWRIFEFCRDHLFTIYTGIVQKISEITPKV